jgi:hypothetical protein
MATNRPIVPAPGDYDHGEIGGMIGRGNRSTRRKPAPVPLCPPQTPHALPRREPGPPRWEASDWSLELRHSPVSLYHLKRSLHLQKYFWYFSFGMIFTPTLHIIWNLALSAISFLLFSVFATWQQIQWIGRWEARGILAWTRIFSWRKMSEQLYSDWHNIFSLFSQLCTISYNHQACATGDSYFCHFINFHLPNTINYVVILIPQRVTSLDELACITLHRSWDTLK